MSRGESCTKIDGLEHMNVKRSIPEQSKISTLWDSKLQYQRSKSGEMPYPHYNTKCSPEPGLITFTERKCELSELMPGLL